MLSLSVYAGMGMGPSAARYREYAAKCVAMANERDGTDKLSMLDMAQAWLDLAEQALRNERFQVRLRDARSVGPPGDSIRLDGPRGFGLSF
jgi:hypothetical protein